MEEPYFARRIIHVFCTCYGHSSIVFTRTMREIYNIESGLCSVYEIMGIKIGAYEMKNKCTNL